MMALLAKDIRQLQKTIGEEEAATETAASKEEDRAGLKFAHRERGIVCGFHSQKTHFR